MVERAIRSLQQHLTGWTDLAVVDDSGNPEWVERYLDFKIELPNGNYVRPMVLNGNKLGYTRAMQTVCALGMKTPRFLFWEEDFILTAPVDLSRVDEILDENPKLAQLALQRGAHFPNEYAAGGMIPGLVGRLGADRVDLQPHFTEGVTEEVRKADGELTFWDQVETPRIEFISQKGTFTCNPAVWQTGIAKLGWPATLWSEDTMRDKLLAKGYRFGFLPEVRVEHDGERSGHGY